MHKISTPIVKNFKNLINLSVLINESITKVKQADKNKGKVHNLSLKINKELINRIKIDKFLFLIT